MSVQFGSGVSFPRRFTTRLHVQALCGWPFSAAPPVWVWPRGSAPPSRSAGVPHLSYRLVARRSLFGAPRSPFHAAAGAFGCSRGKHVSIVWFYSQIKKLR